MFISDEAGDALVYTGLAHQRRSEPAFVVRRAYPTGEVKWVVRTDGQPVSIDEHHGIVFIAFLGATLLGVDAHTGTVRFQQMLTLGGHQVEPLSLACGADGDVYVGTIDGRIINLIET